MNSPHQGPLALFASPPASFRTLRLLLGTALSLPIVLLAQSAPPPAANPDATPSASYSVVHLNPFTVST